MTTLSVGFSGQNRYCWRQKALAASAAGVGVGAAAAVAGVAAAEMSMAIAFSSCPGLAAETPESSRALPPPAFSLSSAALT